MFVRGVGVFRFISSGNVLFMNGIMGLLLFRLDNEFLLKLINVIMDFLKEYVSSVSKVVK